MSSAIKISHSTVYKYPRPVMLGPQTIRLCPRKDIRSTISDFVIRVRPADDDSCNTSHDDHDNVLVHCKFSELVDVFEVDVEFSVELKRPGFYPSKNWLPMRMARAIHREIKYDIRLSPGVQSADETLKLGVGSCRDFAWLLFSDLQQTTIPVRYVSGYLIDEEAQVGDLHAWIECEYDKKWVGIDPTLGKYAGAGHIPVAVGPHYNFTAPISGVVEATEVEFSYEIRIDV